MSTSRWQKTMADFRHKYGDKFVEPRATEIQKYYFSNAIRVEVVSPSGYTRRGIISITSGWAPSLMLIHRRGSSGSWDLLNEDDVIVAAIHDSVAYPINHDKLQVAVYQAQREVA